MPDLHRGSHRAQGGPARAACFGQSRTSSAAPRAIRLDLISKQAAPEFDLFGAGNPATLLKIYFLLDYDERLTNYICAVSRSSLRTLSSLESSEDEEESARKTPPRHGPLSRSPSPRLHDHSPDVFHHHFDGASRHLQPVAQTEGLPVRGDAGRQHAHAAREILHLYVPPSFTSVRAARQQAATLDVHPAHSSLVGLFCADEACVITRLRHLPSHQPDHHRERPVPTPAHRLPDKPRLVLHPWRQRQRRRGRQGCCSDARAECGCVHGRRDGCRRRSFRCSGAVKALLLCADMRRA